MTRSRRGWTNPSQRKQAADVEIRYGHGLLKRESAAWPRHLVVSTPSAYKTARPFLTGEPAAVGLADLMDFQFLKRLSDGLPDDAELVVGLGGGRALDASKYVARWKDLPLLSVPTI